MMKEISSKLTIKIICRKDKWYRNMKVLGLISLVTAIVILLLGVISPLNIITCTIIALLFAGFGAFAVFKSRKN